MSIFAPPNSQDYPRKWKDMSFDFKLMFVFHGCMMILFMIGGALSTRQELVFAGVLLLVLILLSSRHRSRLGWRWDGVVAEGLLYGAWVVSFVFVFFFSASPHI